MSLLNKGIGTIKVTQQKDGSFKASATNVEDFIAPTESAAILGIKENIKKAVEGDESKAPFRVIQ